MDGIFELSRLADWYGALLTPRQLSLVRQYADEDCSLSEIAEREGVSRQAVRDAVARAEKEMLGLEKKLHLIQKDERVRSALSELAEKLDDPALLARIQGIYGLLEDNDGV